MSNTESLSEKDHVIMQLRARITALEELLTVHEEEVERHSTILEEHFQKEQQQSKKALATAERDASTGRLASMVAHQINNPLAAMMFHIEMLKEDLQDFPDFETKIDVIKQQVQRIGAVVKALLGYSRQKAGSDDNISVTEIIRIVTTLFEGTLKSQGITHHLDLSRNIPLINGNPSEIQEVLINLIENSRQALESGNIYISCSATSENIEIIIEDDGPGLGLNPSRVFTPFFTTKIEGTGIGLAISKDICVAHGGDLTAENRSNGNKTGARFRIVLPLNQSSKPTDNSSNEE
ncbi:MAG: hypothetical protein JKX97_02500 [Candidatus Lindowbacteria bacterium]|nr:hypothetical protein [Candidatus Lindowbacteria bacterium]